VAARDGDLASLTAMLDARPDWLHARGKPYEWTLPHAAAQRGHVTCVNALLSDVMGWAEFFGRRDIVEMLTRHSQT